MLQIDRLVAVVGDLDRQLPARAHGKLIRRFVAGRRLHMRLRSCSRSHCPSLDLLELPPLLDPPAARARAAGAAAAARPARAARGDARSGAARRPARARAACSPAAVVPTALPIAIRAADVAPVARRRARAGTCLAVAGHRDVASVARTAAVGACRVVRARAIATRHVEVGHSAVRSPARSRRRAGLPGRARSAEAPAAVGTAGLSGAVWRANAAPERRLARVLRPVEALTRRVRCTSGQNAVIAREARTAGSIRGDVSPRTGPSWHPCAGRRRPNRVGRTTLDSSRRTRVRTSARRYRRRS